MYLNRFYLFKSPESLEHPIKAKQLARMCVCAYEMLYFYLIACARLHYIWSNDRFMKHLKIKKYQITIFIHCNQRKIGNVISNQLLRNTQCWNWNILSINFWILWNYESIHCFGIYLKKQAKTEIRLLAFCHSVVLYIMHFELLFERLQSCLSLIFIAAVARNKIKLCNSCAIGMCLCARLCTLQVFVPRFHLYLYLFDAKQMVNAFSPWNVFENTLRFCFCWQPHARITHFLIYSTVWGTTTATPRTSKNVKFRKMQNYSSRFENIKYRGAEVRLWYLCKKR